MKDEIAFTNEICFDKFFWFRYKKKILNFESSAIGIIIIIIVIKFKLASVFHVCIDYTEFVIFDVIKSEKLILLVLLLVKVLQLEN